VPNFLKTTVAQNILLPLFALTGALLLFGAFIGLGGKDPIAAWGLLFKGAFGDSFSIQNTLQRAAPLMLAALCVAIPARAGLTVIGGEGALVLGALACAGLPYLLPAGMLPHNWIGSLLLLIAAALAGALWIAIVGYLRQKRGVNETISSLLMAYIAIGVFKHLVEGPMKDPASLNKPSTLPLADGLKIGVMEFGSMTSEVHWGLLWGLAGCLIAGIWLSFTSHGFSMQVVGGNARAAKLVGLPATKLIVTACLLGGMCAGIAGGIEVAAVHSAANASVIVGLGYTGILVSFVARHNPWVIPFVAILFGGFAAAGSLLQRRLGVPDASVLVLQGFAFVLILASEGWRKR
jgi:general nucleoside transport system permease protein